jgi:hypothetical protein
MKTRLYATSVKKRPLDLKILYLSSIVAARRLVRTLSFREPHSLLLVLPVRYPENTTGVVLLRVNAWHTDDE